EEALNEVERLEAQLSLYRPGSEISQLNACAAQQPVRVSPELFSLLKSAKQLSNETDGAFDITIAPLVRCWGFMNGSGKIPDADELAEARNKIGMKLVHLNESDFTVRFERPGVMLDLGAIGKGYAVEKAAEILREAGVTSALIHGGTSTVHAIGQPPDAEYWKVAIETPESSAGVSPACLSDLSSESSESVRRRDACATLLTSIPLRDESLSVSAVWGKSFESNGKNFGHVLDPRSGNPVQNSVLAAVVLPSATETDALSTALLVGGKTGHEKISQLRPGIKTLLITESENGLVTDAHGLDLSCE
ncbi:MAG: FAD:protein transferase, partial [Verrucomicrobiota bacterium]